MLIWIILLLSIQTTKFNKEHTSALHTINHITVNILYKPLKINYRSDPDSNNHLDFIPPLISEVYKIELEPIDSL